MSFKWQQFRCFLLENKPAVILTILAGLIANILTVLIPISIGKYYDLVFGYQSHRAVILDYLPFQLWETMAEFLTFFFILVVLKIVADFMERYNTGTLGELFVKNIR